MPFELRHENDENKQMEQSIQAEGTVEGKGLETTVYCVGKFMEIVYSKDRTPRTSGRKDGQRSTNREQTQKRSKQRLGMTNVMHIKYCDPSVVIGNFT